MLFEPILSIVDGGNRSPPVELLSSARFRCTALFLLQGCFVALLKAFDGVSSGRFTQNKSEGSVSMKAVTL